MIDFQNKYEGTEVEKVIVQYTQPGDCCEDDDNWQTIQLETENNGVSPFIRISLPEGGHWSIDGISDFKRILDDFSQKVNYKESFVEEPSLKEIVKGIEDILQEVVDNDSAFHKLTDETMLNYVCKKLGELIDGK